MKRSVIAGIACFLSGVGTAIAADLPPAGSPPPANYVPGAAPVYDWGGIYVGINGGYAFGDSTWGAPVATGNFHVDGGLVGGTIGANFQSGEFVFGVEADGDWTDISGSLTNNTTLIGVIGCTVGPCTYQTSNDWLATLRGRVGYAFDRVLVYATAGGAAGDVKATFTDAGSGVMGSLDNTKFGWTAGAGVEAALTENITAKVEYLYVDLSNSTCNNATVCGTGVLVSFNASLVRVGLNFKFDPF